MIQSCFFLILQRSPVWVIPIATANIINAAPCGSDDSLRDHCVAYIPKAHCGDEQAVSRIIIFDEAASALDSASEKVVQEATASMMKNCTAKAAFMS